MRSGGDTDSLPSTVASVSSSDLSLEEVPPMADALSSSFGHGPLEHPAFFIKEDMVTIQVQNMLFRIPLYVLTKDSSYFSEILAGYDCSKVFQLQDEDVSALAFAHFLTVLLPRVGEASISTLDQWNDALHLSSKWGFDDIRVTSLAAIEPLASAVDKIVLGRLYDFSKWVPDAYVDLLEREESLTVEEARRMPIEDVVTIARGRCEARTAKTRPRAEIESVVKGLLSVGDPPPSPHPLPVPEAPTPPSLAEDTGKEADVDWQSVHQVSRWVIQYENKQSGTAARACLVQWLHEDPIPRIGLFLDSALKRALLSWLETSTPKLQGSRIKLWDWKIYAVQRDLHALPGSTCPMLYNSPLAQEAGGRLVDSWSTLLDLPLDETVECITETKYWKGMSARTNFLAYCVGCRDDDGVFFMSAAVFAPFWTTITLCYTTAAENHKHITARLIHKLLCDVRQSVSKTAVCREMDAFYMTIEQACDKAFLEEGNALADVLKDIINSRHWP